eukprot:357234-Chlamydomonas_euryale.AAC.8
MSRGGAEAKSNRERTQEGHACVEHSKAEGIKQRVGRCHKGHAIAHPIPIPPRQSRREDRLRDEKKLGFDPEGRQPPMSEPWRTAARQDPTTKFLTDHIKLRGATLLCNALVQSGSSPAIQHSSKQGTETLRRGSQPYNTILISRNKDKGKAFAKAEVSRPSRTCFPAQGRDGPCAVPCMPAAASERCCCPSGHAGRSRYAAPRLHAHSSVFLPVFCTLANTASAVTLPRTVTFCSSSDTSNDSTPAGGHAQDIGSTDGRSGTKGGAEATATATATRCAPLARQLNRAWTTSSSSSSSSSSRSGSVGARRRAKGLRGAAVPTAQRTNATQRGRAHFQHACMSFSIASARSPLRSAARRDRTLHLSQHALDGVGAARAGHLHSEDDLRRRQLG